jgi:hypothetical protein
VAVFILGTDPEVNMIGNTLRSRDKVGISKAEESNVTSWQWPDIKCRGMWKIEESLLDEMK